MANNLNTVTTGNRPKVKNIIAVSMVLFFYADVWQ